MPTWPQRLVRPPQRALPIRRVRDGLGDIRGHRRQINLHRRQSRHITIDPLHPLAARLGPSDIERSTGRLDTRHLDPPIGQHQREHARPGSDIQHPPRPELLGDRHIHIEVAAIRIKRVVDRGQPRVLKDVVSHVDHAMPQSRRTPSNISCLMNAQAT